MRYTPRLAVLAVIPVLAVLGISGCDDDPVSPAPNQAPTASYTWNVTDLTVDFTDTSIDPDGTVQTWNWDFGDGGSSAVQHPQHTYAVAGDYTATLSVTDDDGAASAVPASQTASPTAPPAVVYDTVHVQLVAPEVFGIEPSTAYTFTFDNLLAAAPFHDAALFISETNANFNNPGESVSVHIDGVHFGAYEFATDNADTRRTLMVPVPLEYTDMFYIAADGETEITLTTSATGGGEEHPGSPSSMFVWLEYDALEPVSGQ